MRRKDLQIIYKSTIPAESREESLAVRIEEAFQKVSDWFSTSKIIGGCVPEKYIAGPSIPAEPYIGSLMAPAILLDDSIRYDDETYTLTYGPDDRDHIEPLRHLFNGTPPKEPISHLLILGDYEHSHAGNDIIIFYYEAIRLAAGGDEKAFDRILEYELAALLFRMLHYRANEGAKLWKNSGKGTTLYWRKRVLIASLSGYIKLQYCDSQDYYEQWKELKRFWGDAIFTSYPEAKALYFLVNMTTHMPLTLEESLQKHHLVFDESLVDVPKAYHTLDPM